MSLERKFKNGKPELWPQYLELKPKVSRMKHAMHRAQRSLYIGLPKEEPFSDENVARALVNIRIGADAIQGKLIEDGPLKMEGQLIPYSIDNPEAIWLYLVQHQYETVARLGFNFHEESSGIVASIATIQGHKTPMLREFNQALGKGKYWPIEILLHAIDAMPTYVHTVRGIASTAHPFRNCEGFNKHTASRLYDCTFRSRQFQMHPVRGQDDKVKYYETHI